MKKNARKEPPTENNTPAITLTLNGGKDELDSATIPVQWFFSEELARNAPTHLILVDKTKGQFAAQNKGRRYLVRVDQAVLFLQLHRSGLHRLTVLAFNNYENAVSHLLKDGYGYKEHIDDQLAAVADAHCGALAGATVEFNIPAEFFAQEPKNPIGKFFFWYLKWPNKKANDECSVRKAAIFALPKLPFFIAWWVIKFIGFIIFLTYMIIAPIVAILIGYQPICLTEWWERIRDAALYTDINLDIYAGERYQLYHSYRKFNCYQEGKKIWFSPIEIIFYLILLAGLVFAATKMFISGLYMLGFFLDLAIISVMINTNSERLSTEWKRSGAWLWVLLAYLAIVWLLSLIFTSINGFYVAEKRPTHDIISTAFVGLSLVVALLITVTIKSRKQRTKDDSIKKEEPDPALAYRNYLLLNFTKPRNRVNLKQLPETFNSNQKARNFRVSYWALKAKVCRPYEQ